METSDWDVLVRSINIAFAVFGLILLVRKGLLYWDKYQSRTKDFWWVLMCWCLVIVLGTTEVLLGWDTQFRILFTFGALVLTIKVLLRPNEVEKPTFTNEL